MLSSLRRKLSRNVSNTNGNKSTLGNDGDSNISSTPSVEPDISGTRRGSASSPHGPNPTADEQLPKRTHVRRRSSVVRDDQIVNLQELPLLKDTPLNRRETLFRQKLELCCVIFDFEDPSSNKKGKELKRTTLLELVDFANESNGYKPFTEPIMPDVVHMISVNLFRELPPPTEDFDPEEDEPATDPAWPHLQVVYEFCLRFVVATYVKPKIAKRYVDQKFCQKIIDLFDSEDLRERDYLKTILHRMYGKFMSHRGFIRKAVAQTFYRFVFETGRHNGIGEMLEILGSIINGFAIPLKDEHVTFLQRALLPLHRPKCIALYHQQLAYCITQYLDKEPRMAKVIIDGLYRCWPWANSSKQVILLHELEDILELLHPDYVESCQPLLFKWLANLVGSAHFQVAERTLYFWNNEKLLDTGILSAPYSHVLLPKIFPALFKHSVDHWNNVVQSLATSVLQHYEQTHPQLYTKCLQEYQTMIEQQQQVEEEKKRKWAEIDRLAALRAPDL